MAVENPESRQFDKAIFTAKQRSSQSQPGDPKGIFTDQVVEATIRQASKSDQLKDWTISNASGGVSGIIFLNAQKAVTILVTGEQKLELILGKDMSYLIFERNHWDMGQLLRETGELGKAIKKGPHQMEMEAKISRLDQYSQIIEYTLFLGLMNATEIAPTSKMLLDAIARRYPKHLEALLAKINNLGDETIMGNVIALLCTGPIVISSKDPEEALDRLSKLEEQNIKGFDFIILELAVNGSVDEMIKAIEWKTAKFHVEAGGSTPVVIATRKIYTEAMAKLK